MATPTWYEKNATIMKVVLCGFLLLILLIPASMIRGLITERSGRALEAKEEIYSKWGGTQTLTGPIISVPYLGTDKLTHYYHILPDTLNIKTLLSPEVRKRGIFETVVYTSKNSVEADFSSLANSIPSDKKVNWNNAVISFGLSDMRGITGDITGVLSGQDITWQPGLITTDVITTGIHAVRVLNPTANLTLKMTFDLRGGEMVKYLPLGKTTDVEVSSTWENPSFDGAFLPQEKSLTKDGFQSHWTVLHFNRDFPQSWEGSTYQLGYIPDSTVYKYDDFGYSGDIDSANPGNNIGDNAFGVKLIQTVDHYDKSERAAKYAILIIALSFLTFFLLEIVNKKPIHAIQYLLIGFALVVFYTLLLAFAEHVGFNWSYTIASVATISLVGLYTRAIWNDIFALSMSGILAFLYGLIFVILQSEDYALMIGSITIFSVVALVMYVTRRIDWYKPR